MNVKVNRELLKQLRIKHSYSQEKLAEMICVNLRTIQRVETTGVASLSTRGALAKALSVKPEDLDLPQEHTAARTGGPLAGLPRWRVLLLTVVLVVLGCVVLAVSIMSATPIGRMTPPAIGGLLIVLIGCTRSRTRLGAQR